MVSGVWPMPPMGVSAGEDLFTRWWDRPRISAGSRTLSQPSSTSARAAFSVAPAAASWPACALARSFRARSTVALTGFGNRMSSMTMKASGPTSNHKAVASRMWSRALASVRPPPPAPPRKGSTPPSTRR